MRRLFSFFVCICVLAACSPLRYSGEQTARTVSVESGHDSASIHRLVDQLVHDELQQRLDIREWMEQTTVEETFSDPDSAGAQHVIKRSTTTFSKRSKTSAENTQAKDEKYQEQVDSVRKKATVSYIEKEEENKVLAEAKRFVPWYVWPVLLVGAMILGLWMARRKGWISIKGR